MSIHCRSVVFAGPKKVEIRDIDLPDAEANDVVVRTLYSGISAGTELWILTGRYWNAEFPTLPGYQKVGVVEKVSSNVTGYSVGDVVFLRSTRLAPGVVSHWGGHTEYSVVSADEPEMFKLPEGLDPVEAQDRVLEENLFGLELDPRCTEIAAFNVALAAWKAGGYRRLPELNIGCSGIRVAGSRESWLELAGDDPRLRDGLERLHDVFKDADTLGSLIDPRRHAFSAFQFLCAMSCGGLTIGPK
jgi:hypothetical protein